MVGNSMSRQCGKMMRTFDQTATKKIPKGFCKKCVRNTKQFCITLSISNRPKKNTDPVLDHFWANNTSQNPDFSEFSGGESRRTEFGAVFREFASRIWILASETRPRGIEMADASSAEIDENPR